jgi:hypothetical protein
MYIVIEVCNVTNLDDPLSDVSRQLMATPPGANRALEISELTCISGFARVRSQLSGLRPSGEDDQGTRSPLYWDAHPLDKFTINLRELNPSYRPLAELSGRFYQI